MGIKKLKRIPIRGDKYIKEYYDGLCDGANKQLEVDQSILDEIILSSEEAINILEGLHYNYICIEPYDTSFEEYMEGVYGLNLYTKLQKIAGEK